MGRQLYRLYLWAAAGGTQAQKDLLAQLDILVDGEFVLAKRNLDLRFRGSENQRILDVPKAWRPAVPSGVKPSAGPAEHIPMHKMKKGGPRGGLPFFCALHRPMAHCIICVGKEGTWHEEVVFSPVRRVFGAAGVLCV